MIKKRLGTIGSVLLIAVLLLGVPLGALAQDTVALMPFESVRDDIGLQPGTQITVGATTQMSGHFGMEGFSLNTADMDVRMLLHGYSTVSWTRSMGVAFNSAVLAGTESENESDGGRTYTFQLQDDLKYSDGSPVTAKDYVFSILLNGAQAYQAIGATPLSMDHVTGYKAYAAGQSDTISGVRLLSDLSFSIRISGEYLPFFYGLSMLNIMPYPISVIAPGYDVKDDGNGVQMTGASSKLTEELLKKTLLDPATGYEFSPKVTTGPYKLESYDAASNTAVFTVNGQFKGNYEGKKPHIERITFRYVDNASMVSLLESGQVDLLNKVSNPDALEQAQTLAEQGSVGQTNYLRTGLAYLSYACEEGPTASAAVRKAISLCLDVEDVALKAGGKAARRVNGYYGYGQWMATHNVDSDGAGAAISMNEEMAKLAFAKDLSAAKALLEGDGWTLNSAGEPYVEGAGNVRYRQGASGLEPLIIRWAKTSPSTVTDVIEEALRPAMEEIGMQLEVTPMPFDEMLTHLYRQAPRTYNMFYLATNFSHVFDPYYDFHVDDMYQGVVNTSGLRDEQLMNLALQMRETNPNDMAGYARKWLAFQQRFMEQMPMTPLYSSVYFDFFSNRLEGYEIGAHTSWALAVLYSHIAK